MAALTNGDAAKLGVMVLTQIRDKLDYSELADRKLLQRAISLLERSVPNMALVTEAELFMRQHIRDEATRGTIANRLHPRLLHALQESVKEERK